MKTMDEKQIQSLLNKFMEGETTIEEEKILGEYFCTAHNIKAEWEDYKSMFDYFDQGMPYEKPAQETARRGMIVKMVVGVISVAALVALLFTFALPKDERGMQLAANDEPKVEAPAKSDNKVETKEETNKEESVDAKAEKKDEAPVKKLKKRRAPRIRYNIPAPQEYMAQSEKGDTLNAVDKELINSYLYQCASMDIAMEEIYTQEMYEEDEYTTNE